MEFEQATALLTYVSLALTGILFLSGFFVNRLLQPRERYIVQRWLFYSVTALFVLSIVFYLRIIFYYPLLTMGTGYYLLIVISIVMLSYYCKRYIR